VRLTVTQADTAEALGSGDLPVLGTPRLVALLEEAAVAVAKARLEEGQTTVGTRIDLQHLAPSAIGAVVEAHAELVEAEGRRLRFEVRATMDDVEIARGTHERAIVDAARFMARLEGGE
jgi:fluoroacetyl-CoA thioesterase